MDKIFLVSLKISSQTVFHLFVKAKNMFCDKLQKRFQNNFDPMVHCAYIRDAVGLSNSDG